MPSLCRKGQTYLVCIISGSDKKNPSWIKDSYKIKHLYKP